MRYTEYGLQIGLEELEALLENAKNQAQYNCKEAVIYIKGGDKPQILQYSIYAEGNPHNHTYLARF